MDKKFALVLSFIFETVSILEEKRDYTGASALILSFAWMYLPPTTYKASSVQRAGTIAPKWSFTRVPKKALIPSLVPHFCRGLT